MPSESDSSDDLSGEAGVDAILEACRISMDGSNPNAQPAGMNKAKVTGEPLDPESDRKRRPNKSARSKGKERVPPSNIQDVRDDAETGRGRRRNDKIKSGEAETKRVSSSDSDEPTSAAGSKQVNAPDPNIACRSDSLRVHTPVQLAPVPRRQARDRRCWLN